MAIINAAVVSALQILSVATDRFAVAVADWDLDFARYGQVLGGTWEKHRAAKEEVEEALKGLDAAVRDAAGVYGWEEEIVAARERAGLLLGTHERVFGWHKCSECSTVSHREEDRFCLRCGTGMTRVDSVVLVREGRAVKSGVFVGHKVQCLTCDYSIWLEEGSQIQFCPKDGTWLVRATWQDSQGGTWFNPRHMARAEEWAQELEELYQSTVKELAAGAWDSRKESNQLIREYCSFLVTMATAEFTEEEFVNGLHSRLDLVKAGILELIGGFHSPIEKICRGLGVAKQGPEVLAKNSAQAQVLVEQASAWLDRYVVQLTKKADFVNWMAMGCSAILEFLIVVFMSATGMSEEAAARAVFGLAAQRGGGCLAFIRQVNAGLTWVKDGLPSRKGHTLN